MIKNLRGMTNNVSDVVPHEVLEVNTDTSHYARLGWAIVLLGVCGFVLWAALAPLDKGVPLSGNVAVASSRKVIQHQIGGTVDGIVVGLSVFTRGAVVPGGFKLMELVPRDDALIVEGMLPVNLVDKVHQGLQAEMIFSAFNANTTPHIPGLVTHVSADRTVDERTGQAFYKVRAVVAPKGVKMLADLQIRPGMPVDLFVKTGERTMMNYLLKPIFNRANSALNEE